MAERVFISGNKYLSLFKVFCDAEPFYLILDKSAFPFQEHYEVCLQDARVTFRNLEGRFNHDQIHSINRG